MTTIKFIGLDVHKKKISIAIAESGTTENEVRFYGEIENDLDSLEKALRKIQSSVKREGKCQLKVVYEAGPCGYRIYRFCQRAGIDCRVIAPSRIPKGKGDRIKTDRRDAIQLARLHRAEELTEIYVPPEEDEAMRDLSRLREDIQKATKKSKQLLLAFLLRYGFHYSGKTHWSQAHWNWLSKISLPQRVSQYTLQEYMNDVQRNEKQLQVVTQKIQEVLENWKREPVVKAMQSLRGISMISAVTTLAEIGDLNRFEHPQQLMAFLGLVPSEHSSGEKTHRGHITKTGNGHARRALIESSHSYADPARVSYRIKKRQEGVSQAVIELAWKAQQRLCSKYQRMTRQGKSRNIAVTAVARELSGFIWAISKEVSLEVPH